MNFLPEEPPLIDQLVRFADSVKVEIGGQLYIARRLPYYKWRRLPRRVYHAWLVLTNRAIAVQFAQDSKVVRRAAK